MNFWKSLPALREKGNQVTKMKIYKSLSIGVIKFELRQRDLSLILKDAITQDGLDEIKRYAPFP